MRDEVLLWQAVLRIGLHDVANGRDPDWLHSDDFTSVCYLAGFEPSAVRAQFCAERFRQMPRMNRRAA